MKTYGILIVLLCLMQCRPDDDLHYSITFSNKSDYKIWVAWGTCFSDTITDLPGYVLIMPKFSDDLEQPGGYERLANESPVNKILIIVRKSDPFVFDRRYVLSIDSLNKLGWTVNYP
jgi:hypothetical protein